MLRVPLPAATQRGRPPLQKPTRLPRLPSCAPEKRPLLAGRRPRAGVCPKSPFALRSALQAEQSLKSVEKTLHDHWGLVRPAWLDDAYYTRLLEA